MPHERSREAAIGALIRATDDARFIRACDGGHQLWRGPKPLRLRFFVTVCSEGPLPALVTVKGPYDRFAADRRSPRAR